MLAYFGRLNERDRRLYAAVEALKLPYGGVSYIASLLGISRDCIYKGICELKALAQSSDDDDNDDPALPPIDRIRRPGAGRPSAKERNPKLNEAFLNVITAHTAGDPMEEGKLWTDLSVSEISELLQHAGFPEAGEHVVKGLLEDNHFRALALRKELATGYVDPHDRNAQFENIASLREEFISNAKPVIAVDTKKKELLGLLYREGKLYSQDGQRVYDHDYRHLATGKAIPQAIYDYAANKGFINIGTSSETAQFICDGIARWWNWMGRYDYPGADEVMITLDSGGPSGVRSVVFKEKLVELSERIEMKLRIAHYPPYTSKWHPIEHRLFPHVSRALSGVILKSVEMVKELIEKTHTATGLWVRAHVLDKVYAQGEKCSPEWKAQAPIRILRDDLLPEWNFQVHPA